MTMMKKILIQILSRIKGFIKKFIIKILSTETARVSIVIVDMIFDVILTFGGMALINAKNQANAFVARTDIYHQSLTPYEYAEQLAKFNAYIYKVTIIFTLLLIIGFSLAFLIGYISDIQELERKCVVHSEKDEKLENKKQ